jgi:hypothetical protein
MNESRRLDHQVHALLRQARDVHRGDATLSAALDGHLARVTEPLRVAIAGKVKAGKSTLLNALVGEQIAATDSAECTRAVTWYRDATSPRITLRPREGADRQLPIVREAGALTIDLGGVSPDEVERLVVDWPSSNLKEATLIDTPGIGSVSTAVSARTNAFLLGRDEPAEADAVIYLMRHVHLTDVKFLESFQDRSVARAPRMSSIAVLARADEIGAGRLDAMASAQLIARRYAADDRLRGLCQTVVPVAGLLAQTARTLRQDEFTALAALAARPRGEIDSRLLSADRFLGLDLASGSRTTAALLDRLGLFGVKLAVTLIRQGFDTPSGLAGELVRRSGLTELRRVLGVQFGERGHLLKARSGLLALDVLLRHDPRPESLPLIREMERLVAGAHEFAELRLLDDLRSGGFRLPGDVADGAERLLGGAGTETGVRLGLEAGANRDDQRRAALAAITEWQRRAENPSSGRQLVRAARVIVRSCEGLLAEISR